jgi:hypothetical protein
MRSAAAGGTTAAANRRSTRQAQLWRGAKPGCDEEYDHTKLNTYGTLHSPLPKFAEL